MSKVNATMAPVQIGSSRSASHASASTTVDGSATRVHSIPTMAPSTYDRSFRQMGPAPISVFWAAKFN